MQHIKKSLLIAFISSVFLMSAIVFYRFTSVELALLNQAQNTLASYSAHLVLLKEKKKVLEKDEAIIKNIDTKVVTNFKVSLTSSSFKQLINEINNFYGSGIVVVNNAKIQSSNGTLNCTIEGFRLGL
ncbi:MAG: hypothetical protein ACPLXO_04425 [Desulfurella sp.]|uniref:hypothetical protein n=1 Tax=Desulfurella sp. TaxID=1962857 RepID=UPI003C8B2E57